MQVRDPSGRKYSLTEPIGKGGEAVVYRVGGRGKQLAKIYNQPTPGHEDKLVWMIDHPPDDPAKKMRHTSIAWPTHLLYRENNFAGYLMPFIENAVPALQVYNPRLRLQTFRKFTTRHLINTAFNIAAALGAVHARGYVVGDLNEMNVLVARSTLVTLIDTDSFQVHARTSQGGLRTHLCRVGKPEYLPPELHGKDLGKTVRLPEHDRFALAVLIYQLLMDGAHPFRAKWIGKGEKPSLQDRIRQGLFPHRDTTRALVEPVADLSVLHPLIADLFKRCFILGHGSPSARPSPAEWEHALAEAAVALVSCRKGHVHSSHLSACPECAKTPLPRRKPVPATVPPVSHPPSPPSALPAAPSRPHVHVRPGRIPKTSQNRRKIPTWIPAGVQFWMHPRFQRARMWMRRRNVRLFALQPALWALGGGLMGWLLGSQLSGETASGIIGLVSGLTCGALTGDLVEKRMGWDVFFGGFGALAGVLIWNGLESQSGLAGGLVAGASGAFLGVILGRYGRFANLTLIWAAAGAAGGWFLGRSLTSMVENVTLSVMLSGAVMGLLAGAAFAIWRRFGQP